MSWTKIKQEVELADKKVNFTNSSLGKFAFSKFTGETWLINENPDVVAWDNWSINFTSNGTSCYRFGKPSSTTVWYVNGPYPITAVANGQWTNQAYRTIKFSTAPTGDLLTWLQANAVKQE